MVLPVGGDSEPYGRQVSVALLAEHMCFIPVFCPDMTDLSWSQPEGMRCPFKVVQQFRHAGFMVDMNSDQSATLNKKIRSAQLSQYNYIFGKGL